MTSNKNAAEILKTLESIDFDTFENDDERRAVLAATRKLTTKLERPWETVVHLTWAIPAAHMALKIGVDTGLFEKMKVVGKPTNPTEMATATNTNTTIMSRVMRQLGSMNYLIEESEDQYSLGRFTEALTDPIIASSLDFLFDMWGLASLKSPEYLAKNDYKVPDDAFNGIWQYIIDSPGKPLWEWLSEDEKKQAQFGKFMSGYASDREAWVDIYPTEKIISKTAGNQDVALVDVGGSIGHDAAKMVKKHPETGGRIVVQDQESVLASAPFPDSIKPMPHDFFTAQPVKGAHVYYLHSILHDWPDESCIQILSQLKEAMTPGKSVLLINENVIPPTNAHHHMTAQDLIMMSFFASRERSERDWRNLLERGGFNVTKVYPGKVESVIEAVPV